MAGVYESGGKNIIETVEVTFKYTQAEYVKADRQYLIASKTISKTSIVILAIFLPASLIYLFFTSYSILGIIFIAVGIVAAIVGSALYFYIPIYKFKITPKYNDEYILSFSGDGIAFRTPSIDSIIKWDMYSEIWESMEFYFLIQSPRLYTLIPKRIFKSPDDMRIFEEIAVTNLKCTKRQI